MLNEQKKDQEVKAVRLENIKLKNRLQKREKQLKQKVPDTTYYRNAIKTIIFFTVLLTSSKQRELVQICARLSVKITAYVHTCSQYYRCELHLPL